MSATIVAVPKKTVINSLSDFRPLVLTPTVMKCFERLVLKHIKSALPPILDQHQFTYRANRSRMLLPDYNSVFNTIIPSRMLTKLLKMNIGQQNK